MWLSIFWDLKKFARGPAMVPPIFKSFLIVLTSRIMLHAFLATTSKGVFRIFGKFLKHFEKMRFSAFRDWKIHAWSGQSSLDFNNHRTFMKLIIHIPCDIIHMKYINFFGNNYKFSRKMRFSSLLDLEKFAGHLVTVPPIIKSFAIIVFIITVARFSSFSEYLLRCLIKTIQRLWKALISP